MIRRAIILATLIAVAIAGASCQAVSPTTPNADTGLVPLTGTEWFLGEMQGQPLVHDEAVTATFGDDGTLKGVAACNEYETRYEASDGEMTIDPNIEAGLEVCEPAVMALQSAYLASLQSVASYEIDAEVLFMRDNEGTVSLVFDASAE